MVWIWRYPIPSEDSCFIRSTRSRCSSERPGVAAGSPENVAKETAVGGSLATCTATTRWGSIALKPPTTPAPMSLPWAP